MPGDALAAGERIVRTVGERNAIPVAFLRADLEDPTPGRPARGLRWTHCLEVDRRGPRSSRGAINPMICSMMAGDRARYGLLISTLGAIVLAVSVFLPWYGVSFTASGLTFAQQIGDQAASQFGNAALQSYMGNFHTGLSSLAGHQFMALSAHQALKDLNVVLLLLAGLAVAIALMALAGPGFSSSRWPSCSARAARRRGRGVRALSNGRSPHSGR